MSWVFVSNYNGVNESPSFWYANYSLPLLTQSVHVTLPKAVETAANIKEQSLQRGIDAQGLITLNKMPVADLASLEAMLKAELLKNPEIGLHLYADQDVVYVKVAAVMATVQHAGMQKIAFVTVQQ